MFTGSPLTSYSAKIFNNWFGIQLLVSKLLEIVICIGSLPQPSTVYTSYGLSKGALHKNEKNTKTIVPPASSTQKKSGSVKSSWMWWGGCLCFLFSAVGPDLMILFHNTWGGSNAFNQEMCWAYHRAGGGDPWCGFHKACSSFISISSSSFKAASLNINSKKTSVQLTSLRKASMSMESAEMPGNYG